MATVWRNSGCKFTSSFIVLLHLISLVWATQESPSQQQQQQQYCEGDTFSASCSRQDEVIIVNEALFGRMRTGKCISDQLAFFMGCSINVLPFMELQCSGRQSCSVRVLELIAKGFKNCTSEMASYLEVSYSCIPVTYTASHCSAATPVPVPRTRSGEGEGYLSSYVAQQTGCGSVDSPWSLEVARGQTITLTLLDFSYYRSQTAGGAEINVCFVYATIREGSSQVAQTVCGHRGNRIERIFISSSNSVEIRLVVSSLAKASTDANGHFLIKYTVEGCADPVLPTGAWIKRDAAEAVVGCRAAGEGGASPTWLLKCVDGTWSGQVGVCPSQSPSGSSPARGSPSLPSGPWPAAGSGSRSPAGELPSKPVVSDAKSNDNSSHTPPGHRDQDENDEIKSFITMNLAVIVASGSAVLITILIFILGVYYLRRKSAQEEAAWRHHMATNMTYDEAMIMQGFLQHERECAAARNSRRNVSSVSSPLPPSEDGPDAIYANLAEGNTSGSRPAVTAATVAAAARNVNHMDRSRQQQYYPTAVYGRHPPSSRITADSGYPSSRNTVQTTIHSTRVGQEPSLPSPPSTAGVTEGAYKTLNHYRYPPGKGDHHIYESAMAATGGGKGVTVTDDDLSPLASCDDIVACDPKYYVLDPKFTAQPQNS